MQQMEAHRRRGTEILARIGYTAKGVVYGLVGVLAFKAAIGSGGDASAGAKDAISAIGRQPFGQILLVLTAIGLAGYAVWRFTQAIADTENRGSDGEGLLRRAGYAVSGVVYVGLAVLAFTSGIGSGGGGGGSSQQSWTARLLSESWGRWAVGLIGVVIVIVGLDHFRKVVTASFMDKYRTGEMSATQRTWARRIGRVGLAARGVTFVLIGIFFLQAAWQSQASEAKGLAGALGALGAAGPWFLGIVAAGFVAYGVHCLAQARYRRIQTS